MQTKSNHLKLFCMNKIRYLTSVFLLAMLAACVHDPGQITEVPSEVSPITVEEARAYFERNGAMALTRSGSDNPFPFIPGTSVPDWSEAAPSSSDRLSSVDVPLQAEYSYRVFRKKRDGEFYSVPASVKLIVVRSAVTGREASYLRVCIPDAEYAAIYDGDIGAMTLNCEDRIDYSGLEYYATLDGRPVAVSRYDAGRYTAGVFLYDRSLTLYERARRYASLFHNMWIERSAAGLTRGGDEWNYGAPGSIFVGSDGGLYRYVDIDGDGKSDAITMVWDWSELFGGGGGSSSGGGSSGGGDSGGGDGSSGGSPGSGAGPGVPGIGNPGGPGGSGIGGGTGGSDGDGSGNEEGDDDGDSEGDSSDEDGIRTILPISTLDPIPWKDEFSDDDFPEEDGDGSSDVQERDCEEVSPEAGNNSVKTNQLYADMSDESQFSQFQDSVSTKPGIEFGVTGYLDENGDVKLNEPYTDNNPGSVRIRLKKKFSNLSMIHNHPSGSACSVGDVYALAYFYAQYENFRSIYVCTTEGSIYVIYIYNEALATQFADFINSSAYDGRFRNLYDWGMNVLRLKYDSHTSHLYALAYALKALNTGIAILSKGKDDSTFHQHEVEVQRTNELSGMPEELGMIKCK